MAPVALGFVLSLCALMSARPTVAVPKADSVVLRTSPRRYRVTCSFVLQAVPKDATRVSLVFPLPSTDIYQDVANFQSSAGEVLDIAGTDDRCLRLILEGDAVKAERRVVLTYRYDITLFDIGVDLGRVTKLRPYDDSDPAVRLYTGPSGAYVNPAEPRIVAAADAIWGESRDVLDYARRCYEYVSRKFAYINPGSGLRPLAQVLNDGGGDCGNLSSVLISLLRRKGVPARAAVAIDITNGADGHAWAEFYLQGYGWIPVDVTAHKESGRDFFGSRMPGRVGEWAVVSNAINPTLDFAIGREDVSMLQWIACRCRTDMQPSLALDNMLYGFSVQSEPIE